MVLYRSLKFPLNINSRERVWRWRPWTVQMLIMDIVFLLREQSGQRYTDLYHMGYIYWFTHHRHGAREGEKWCRILPGSEVHNCDAKSEGILDVVSYIVTYIQFCPGISECQMSIEMVECCTSSHLYPKCMHICSRVMLTAWL